MDYRPIIGALAIFVGVFGYIPYIRDIIRDKTKPHAFSWMVWGLIEAIVFVIQFLEKAGPGAWVTGFNALVCFGIGITALSKNRDFSLLDWVSLGGAVFSLILWQITNTSLYAIIFLVITDALAFSITFRKSFTNPFEETLISYFFSGLKSFIAIFALASLSLSNWLFLAYLVIFNFVFVGMCLVRRKQLAYQKAPG